MLKILFLLSDRVKIIYQLNLDQASLNPFETIKNVYDTEGIGGYFLGWQYRLWLIVPFLMGGSVRRFSLLTMIFVTGAETRAQLGLHIESYLIFIFNLFAIILISKDLIQIIHIFESAKF